jgi:raffinose/stachyose/melibiose transport system substrate-binding protein
VDDKNQGLCAGTENYWAVNADASDADINATLDFMYWMVTSDKGTDALAEKMGFVAPFKNAKRVNNELSNIADEYVNKGKASITWAFSVTPNVDVWRDRLVDALADYTVGKGKWSSVEDAFVKGWKEQYEASKQ